MSVTDFLYLGASIYREMNGMNWNMACADGTRNTERDGKRARAKKRDAMERIGKISFTISLRGVKKGRKGIGQEWKVRFSRTNFGARKLAVAEEKTSANEKGDKNCGKSGHGATYRKKGVRKVCVRQNQRFMHYNRHVSKEER